MKSSLLIISALFIIAQSYSQWQNDVRITNANELSYTSINNSRCIAANGNRIHIVWYDYRDGSFEVYYRRSDNGGLSWGTEQPLTNSTNNSVTPSIAVYGSNVHIVWMQQENTDLYYVRSTDNGSTWIAPVRLTNNSSFTENPCIAVSGMVVVVTWQDTRDGNYEIYYKRSTNAGVSWGADTRLTNAAGSSLCASVAISGLKYHVVWEDIRDGTDRIYYKRSLNSGATWTTDLPLTMGTKPSLAITDTLNINSVHVVLHRITGSTEEIYYFQSFDGGERWEDEMRLTNNTGASAYANVRSSGTIVHVVWQDNTPGNLEIFYRRSTNDGLYWGSETRLTNNGATSKYAHVTASGSIVHLIWTDNRDGNDEIYYKRNPTGNTIGIKNISTEIPKEFSLGQNYPNPFNPKTRFKLQIADYSANSGLIRLIIYDVIGREVTPLVNEKLKPGEYEVDWDGSNYPSGIYFYKLSAGNFSESKKMILIK